MNSKDFLIETKFCDYSHPALRAVAEHLRKKYSGKSEADLAVGLFYFVRDYTHYRVGNWRRTASQTFFERGGTCTNNANLLVALCRALNIPAGYGVMEVKGPDYFGPITPSSLASSVSKKTKHVYACIYLAGKWIKCDPSDDEILSINTQHLNPQSTLVTWNGVSDAILNLHPSHILSDNAPLATIDHIINKKQRIALYIPVKIANYYIDFLRHFGSSVDTIDKLEPKFLAWMRRKHFFFYIGYQIFLKYLAIKKWRN